MNELSTPTSARTHAPEVVPSLPPIEFEREFAAAIKAAEADLSARASSIDLFGRVYVYDSFPFNWLDYAEQHACVNFTGYEQYKTAGDLHLARALLDRSHPW